MAKKKSRNSFPHLIGVIHLLPLAGAPRGYGVHPAELLSHAAERAITEAGVLEKAGFEGLILENFGDIPFYKSEVPPETVASLSVIATAVRESVKIPVGINVLRNDACAALAIAAVTGCDFIRVNVLSGVVATDQGMIEGCAAELMREKNRLGAEVAVLADAHVKHGKILSSKSLSQNIEDIALRALADGVIITGNKTGELTDLDRLLEAHQKCKELGVPLWVGSGVNPRNVSIVKSRSDGIIVGSALRKGWRAGASLELKRVKEFIQAYSKKKK